MKQSLVSRLCWFVVGGLISVTLNIGPFHWMRTRTSLSDGAALAISLTCVTLIFSVWNYFINFRTRRGWRECQMRYLAAVGFCYLLTYSLALSGIKQWGHTKATPSGDETLDILAYCIVAGAQIGVAGLKFFLYHFWVYPHASDHPAA